MIKLLDNLHEVKKESLKLIGTNWFGLDKDTKELELLISSSFDVKEFTSSLNINFGFILNGFNYSSKINESDVFYHSDYIWSDHVINVFPLLLDCNHQYKNLQHHFIHFYRHTYKKEIILDEIITLYQSIIDEDIYIDSDYSDDIIYSKTYKFQNCSNLKLIDLIVYIYCKMYYYNSQELSYNENLFDSCKDNKAIFFIGDLDKQSYDIVKLLAIKFKNADFIINLLK